MANPKRINDLEVRRLHETHSNYQIATILGCHEASVRRSLARLEQSGLLVPHLLPTLQELVVDTPITLINPRAVVTADWHIPLYDAAYVNSMIATARRLDLRTLIIAGDFFNFDSLSAYDPKQDEAGLEREVLEAQNVMRTLGETFDEIVFVWGNHDARLHRSLGFKMQFKTAMQMVFGEIGQETLDKIRFTNLDHVWVEFPNHPDPDKRRWYICHPASYSRVPLSNPRRLAAKYNANVITAHAHHAAIGYAEDGRKTAAEAGGFFDKTKTAYLQRSTTFPTWQQGYGYFLNGRFILTTPDWEIGLE